MAQSSSRVNIHLDWQPTMFQVDWCGKYCPPYHSQLIREDVQLKGVTALANDNSPCIAPKCKAQDK